MPSFEEVLEHALEDPELRAEWDRTEVARDLSIAILRYRTERRMTQTQFGRVVGLSQSRIARLEMGEFDPTLDTLRNLAGNLEWTICIEIGPVSSTCGPVSSTLTIDGQTIDGHV